MVDPLSLSAIGAVALTEGIKFLYNQAGEVLKRWRERKDAAAKGAPSQIGTVEPIEVTLPADFEGQISALEIHFDAVERLEKQLRELRKDVADYADGIETMDTADENLLQRVNALRRLLEVVYQQRLTFKGEHRSEAGPMVIGQIDVEEVAGYASAVHAGVVTGGNVSGYLKARRVEPGGRAIGVDIDKIGE